MYDLRYEPNWMSSSEKIIIHENYDSAKILNNIALVKTLESAPLNGKLRKIRGTEVEIEFMKMSRNKYFLS